MVGSGLAPRGRTHRIPAALHAKPAKPSQAKPSQAKPSQAKPSQAKPSQAHSNVQPAWHAAIVTRNVQATSCNVHPASVKTCLQPIDEVRVCFVQRACACRIMVGTRRPSTCPHLPPRASACPRPAGRVPMRVLTTPPGPLPRLCWAPPANSRSTQSVAARSRPKRAVRWADERSARGHQVAMDAVGRDGPVRPLTSAAEAEPIASVCVAEMVAPPVGPSLLARLCTQSTPNAPPRFAPCNRPPSRGGTAADAVAHPAVRHAGVAHRCAQPVRLCVAVAPRSTPRWRAFAAC